MFSLSSSEDYFLEEADSNIQANLEDSVVQEALKSGVDLREYSEQVEEELKAVENKSIQDYIRESQNIASLHNQIVNCDQILGRMENMLISFQSDLGSISTEILSLQQQSVQMNLKLKNRQAVKGELSQFVSDMVIPEKMITTILENPVTDPEFLDQLLNLEQKITFLKEQSFREARSCNDVRDVVDKLKIKAISKIREFHLEKINQFKKPMANYHIPQNTMLQFRFYYKFLLANNRDVAKEVREEYIDTMSKCLFSYCKSYSGRLLKLQFDETATRDDLMGVDDTAQRTTFFSKVAVKSKASVFSMGKRKDVLDKLLEAPILIPHSQQKMDSKYPYEVLFRSEQYCILENAHREFTFVNEFFILTGTEGNEVFTQVMGKALGVVAKQVDGVVQESFDSISLFLCMHLVSRFKELCHKKGFGALDRYWESLTSLIWPRFSMLMQMNTQSIKECDPLKMKAVDQRPHYVTRRYAEFAAGLLSVNDASMSPIDEKVSRLLSDMQQEVEHFILKMTSVFEGRKSQLIFLINNYDMVLSILSEHSHGESRELDSFKDLLATRSAEYVEQILQPHFGTLVKFVQDSEVHMASGSGERALREEFENVSVLLRNFNAGWKRGLDAINQEVLSSFPNFKNGTQILQQTLTQFVQYYHRFHKVMSHASFASHPDRAQLINIHQLMVEVKKYKPSF